MNTTFGQSFRKVLGKENVTRSCSWLEETKGQRLKFFGNYLVQRNLWKFHSMKLSIPKELMEKRKYFSFKTFCFIPQQTNSAFFVETRADFKLDNEFFSEIPIPSALINKELDVLNPKGNGFSCDELCY